MKSKKRMRFILQAARTSVEVIERNGFKCVLVGPIAEYLHGSRTLPQDVSLVALPNSDGRPTPESVAEILQNSHPCNFRGVLHQGTTSHLRYYYDGSTSEEREHFCMIHLLRVDHTSPIPINDIVRLKNLPTAAPLIHLLLRTMSSPTPLESLGKSSDCAEAPSPQVITLNNCLLAEKERTLTASSSDTLFKSEATSVLGRASRHLPHFSNLSMTTTPFPPAIDPPAESLGSTSLPTTTESANLTFINSLDEFDSGPEDVQPQQPNPNPSPDIDPRIPTICRMAKKVVNLLHDLNIHCALFGSVACWLYGNTRVPDDIDLLVFPPPDMPREHLKQILQQTHPRLRLERPANPDASFKILYFHLDGITGPRGFFPQNKCKIDVLIPGILHLPKLSTPQILHLGGLPVVPFALLLLQKLQAWNDHRKFRWSSYPKKYAKATIDARDLQQLLTLDEHVVPLRVSQPWNDNNDSALFTEEFILLSHQRVRDFCESFPACKQDFELLGLFFSQVDVWSPG